MKIVMANLMFACVGLIVLSLMFIGISNAEFDLKTVAGMWLFDEGKGDTAVDSSENGKDGELVMVRNGQKTVSLERRWNLMEMRVKGMSLSGIWVCLER